MGSTIDEKTPTQEQPAHKWREAATVADIHKRQRIQCLGKGFALIGIAALLLLIFNRGWGESNSLQAMNHREVRKRRIDTGSQGLDADFDLFDLLSIRSSSGSINIGVYPQPAGENPEPAELLINSHSGSISVKFATFNMPERNYHVSINSHSGSIGGTILHGQSTSIESKSARIDMQLAPYGTADCSSTLSTTTFSGGQDITLLSPEMDRGASIKEMSSIHSTTSGSLVLRYPKEWEGTVEGHTQSGGLQLHGGDLDIIHRHSLPSAGHSVLAKKGKGNGTLKFHTGSGSVDIYFD